MKKTLLLLLTILTGVMPVASAASQKSTPFYVVSLYSEIKPGYEQLKALGYKPDRMVVSQEGITALDLTGLMPSSIEMPVDSFIAAESNGDDTIALFYKAAEYAKKQGDDGMYQLFIIQLRREMAAAYAPGWLASAWSLTKVAGICLATCLILAFSLRPEAEYKRLQQRALFPSHSSASFAQRPAVGQRLLQYEPMV